jgi:hypothetical protein
MEKAKAVCIAFVLSLAAGWLSRKFIQGHISADDKAALVILLITVLTIIGIFCTLGIRRWRRGQLSTTEKVFMVASLVLLVVMYITGWCSDIG